MKNRVNVNAVKTDVTMPMANVTANPRMGPAPSWNKIIAANNVVMLASRMVPNARLYPRSIDVTEFLPAEISSRIRSKIKTLASTAMPTVKTIPAMPGNVSVAEAPTARPSLKTD